MEIGGDNKVTKTWEEKTPLLYVMREKREAVRWKLVEATYKLWEKRGRRSNGECVDQCGSSRVSVK